MHHSLINGQRLDIGHMHFHEIMRRQLTVLGGKEEFYNHTTENVNSVKAVVNPYYLASKNWTFAMTLSTAMDWYSSQYSGTSLAHANQRRGESKFNVKAFWQPSYNLQLSLAPGGYLSYWKVGNERSDCFFRPTVNASAYWNPDKKLSCGHQFAILLRRTRSRSIIRCDN